MDETINAIRQLILAARTVAHQLLKGPYGVRTPIEVEHLAVQMQSMYPDIGHIRLTQDSSVADPLFGAMVRREGVATIIVDPTLNSCYRRFAAAKELCHLLPPGRNHRGTSRDYVEGLIGAFVTAVPAPAISDHNLGINVDIMGVFPAIELLMPTRLMQRHIELANENGDDISNIKIARQFRIPEKYVAIRRLRDPVIANLFAEESRDQRS